MAAHDPLPIRQHVGTRPGRLARALAAILALALATILALTLPHARPSSGHAAAPFVERIDLHWSKMDSRETEINVAVGTANDCGATLTSGQYCLRYSVTQEDQLRDVGFAVILTSHVQMNGPTLTLDENTTRANVHHLHGSGGSIHVTWTPGTPGSPTTARGHRTTVAPATVAGTVDGIPLVGAHLQGSVVFRTQ